MSDGVAIELSDSTISDLSGHEQMKLKDNEIKKIVDIRYIAKSDCKNRTNVNRLPCTVISRGWMEGQANNTGNG